MTALLTDNLPLLAGAPNGIKKLRELILELAVRGKLVPQDPSDEPASELLKRIAEGKARLVAEGKIKKQKALAEITEEEKPFVIPTRWEWVRLDSLLKKIGAGSTPLGGKQAYVADGIKFLRSQNVWNEGLRLHDVAFIPEATHQKMSGTHVEAGDLLFNITGASIGRCATVPSDFDTGNVSQHVTIIRPVSSDTQPFLHVVLVSQLVQQTVMDVQVGVSREGLSIGKLAQFLIPFPPLAEQHRIVAKVDELMALCDRLEAQQADAESAHTQLVQALLDSLTQASDATDFATNWQRLAEHFHTLFTTESSIDALKQTVLQLAVMGKLVPQDQSDEPASKLLERISNNRLNNREKKQKPIADISEVEKPFDLPSNWTWVTLPAVGELARGKSRHRPRNDPSLYKGGNIPLIQTGDVARANGIVKTYSAMYNAKGVEQSRLWPAGTMCITIAANIGDSAVLGFDACFPDSVVGFTPDFSDLDVRYFEFFLRTAKSRLEEFAPSTAQKNINLETLGLLCVPLPPANEMHRIVAKVDQLTDLCDHLKSYLNQARQLNKQLASALVERVLTEDRQRVLFVPDRLIARTLLATEITHQLHSQRTFGQRKLQKVIYLAEHAARLATIQGDYLRDAAGPHDRQLMNKVEGEMQNHQWYERIERETVGHAYRPLSQAGKHRQAYSNCWSVAERATIEQVIELMREWDTDRCEMTVTLYAAWNDFILEGRPVSDDAIVDEVMHSWNDTKLRFGKTEWLAVLAEMKKHKILTPSGFGKRTTGGMLSLPGFE
ncbi:restriction endonuclease [Pseudomonas protegens]|uniref:restriction endonuclease subunit S n=1 Tax=Pseudomonas protegens TaxID=380021 RepID=UPI000F4B2862|nr:restriction endonuclease subunit S [Pseudomonas protegens]ROL64984.1 restriction endonuclease [Pseudomonas protegens]